MCGAISYLRLLALCLRLLHRLLRLTLALQPPHIHPHASIWLGTASPSHPGLRAPPPHSTASSTVSTLIRARRPLPGACDAFTATAVIKTCALTTSRLIVTVRSSGWKHEKKRSARKANPCGECKWPRLYDSVLIRETRGISAIGAMGRQDKVDMQDMLCVVAATGERKSNYGPF